MIHVNSIANAVYTTMTSDSTIINSGFTVNLNEVFNSSPDRVPWIGIYADNIEFEPMRIGTVQAKPWDAHISIEIYVQEISMAGARKANDRLYRAMFPVLSAVNCNLNLSGTVRIIQSIEIAPFQRDILEEDNYFSNVITLNAVVRA